MCGRWIGGREGGGRDEGPSAYRQRSLSSTVRARHARITRRLLSNPAPGPWVLQVHTLHSSIVLVAEPGSDFRGHSWAVEKAAVAELDSLLALVDSGVLPARHEDFRLVRPDWPDSWRKPLVGRRFRDLAERYDRAATLLEK